jgi:hypothetical protein
MEFLENYIDAYKERHKPFFSFHHFLLVQVNNANTVKDWLYDLSSTLLEKDRAKLSGE